MTRLAFMQNLHIRKMRYALGLRQVQIFRLLHRCKFCTRELMRTHDKFAYTYKFCIYTGCKSVHVYRVLELYHLIDCLVETRNNSMLSHCQLIQGHIKYSVFEIVQSGPHCLSRVNRKPTFCICENKDADQLNREADQRLWFRYLDNTMLLLPKSKFSASSHLK